LRYVIERNVLEPTQFEALTDEDFDTPQDLKHWLSTIEQRLEAAAAEQGAHEESHNHEQA